MTTDTPDKVVDAETGPTETTDGVVTAEHRAMETTDEDVAAEPRVTETTTEVVTTEPQPPETTDEVVTAQPRPPDENDEVVKTRTRPTLDEIAQAATQSADTSAEVEQTERRPDLVWDAEAPGLCVRVYGNGEKSFVFVYRRDDRQRFVRIGTTPRWSLEGAHRWAKELRSAVDRGDDPEDYNRERQEIANRERLWKASCDSSKRPTRASYSAVNISNVGRLRRTCKLLDCAFALLAWRILALRSSVDPGVDNFGVRGRYGRGRDWPSCGRRGLLHAIRGKCGRCALRAR